MQQQSIMRWSLAAATVVLISTAVVGAIGLFSAQESMTEVGSQMFFSDLAGGATDFTSRSVVPYNGKSTSVLMTPMRVYSGPVASEYIEALLDAGKGDALECRLTEEAHAELRDRIKDVRQALWRVTMSCLDEERIAREALRERKHDVWAMSVGGRDEAHDKKTFESFMKVVRKYARKRAATTATDSHDGATYHYLLRRKDFPEYWHYMDMQLQMFGERRERVAATITDMYRKRGTAILRSE